MPSHIATQIAEIKAELRDASEKSSLCHQAAQLIAVSKQQPEDRIIAALDAGHRLFGENRVQEAQTKWPALQARYNDVTLHLIGPLQSNKAKDALQLFDVIHTLDRPRLADTFSTLLGEEGSSYRTRDFLIQINTGEEAQKAGIAPRDANDFIAYCKNDCALPISGLMCIPPAADDAALHFALLHSIATRNHLPALSMGMSNDYLEAARFGASYVRIGTAVFGERPGH